MKKEKENTRLGFFLETYLLTRIKTASKIAIGKT
jgi:hypothetical protein